MKPKQITLTYFEHYPHYMGTMDTKMSIDLDSMILASVVLGTKDEDDHENIYEDISDGHNGLGDGSAYALATAIRGDNWPITAAGQKKHLDRVLKALATKGYWADMWEEGSHALAMPGKEKQAIHALALIEAQIEEDAFDF